MASLKLHALLFLLCFSLVCAQSVSVTVNTNQNRRSINPQIYGVNHFSTCLDQGCTSTLTSVGDIGFQYPLNRFGGNGQTRYAYDINKGNSAADWYFVSLTVSQRAGFTKSIDQFVTETKQMQAEPLIQVPMIGWLPKSTTPDKCWGSSVRKYGGQDSVEPYESDAGNGKVGGTPLPNLNPPRLLDPADCSRLVDQTYATAEVNYLKGKFGAAASGGVKYYALDNEIGLWHSTHFDVHPNPVGYDEMWNKSLAYAQAIRAAEPNAVIFSPSAWGWCEYFYSAKDGCSGGADRAAHGNVDLLAWFLQKARTHYLATGFKVVDVLDVHYYPQAGEYSDTVNADLTLKRMDTVRALYEVGYRDPSWIGNDVGQSIYLIPRMKDMVASTGDPNFVKLSISEYSWGGIGNNNDITFAIPQAEAMAIFGREGVDYAARWVAPSKGSCVENAFKLYLNYDGAGGKITGDSVSATSTATNTFVTTYAIHDLPGGKIFVLVFNKEDNPAKVINVNVGQAITQQVKHYSFDMANCNILSLKNTITPSGNGFSQSVTRYSVNLFVVPVSASGTSPAASASRSPAASASRSPAAASASRSPAAASASRSPSAASASRSPSVSRSPAASASRSPAAASASRSPSASPAVASLIVYDDALRAPFADWSWGSSRSFANTNPVYQGTYSISFASASWEGLYLSCNSGSCFSTSSHRAVRFWIRSAGAANQNFIFQLVRGGNNIGSSKAITPITTAWTQITINFNSISGLTAGNLSGFYIQSNAATFQQVYIDYVELIPGITIFEVEESVSTSETDGGSASSLQSWMF